MARTERQARAQNPLTASELAAAALVGTAPLDGSLVIARVLLAGVSELASVV